MLAFEVLDWVHRIALSNVGGYPYSLLVWIEQKGEGWENLFFAWGVDTFFSPASDVFTPCSWTYSFRSIHHRFFWVSCLLMADCGCFLGSHNCVSCFYMRRSSSICLSVYPICICYWFCSSGRLSYHSILSVSFLIDRSITLEEAQTIQWLGMRILVIRQKKKLGHWIHEVLHRHF